MLKYKNDLPKFMGKYLIGILFFIGIAIILRTCIPEPTKVDSYTAPFLADTEAEADSLLGLMSLDDKLKKLIFFRAGNVTELDTSTYKYGGIMYQVDSLGLQKNILKKINSNASLSPLLALKQNELFPNFLYRDFPNLEKLNATGDDSLGMIYLDLAIEAVQNLGQNFFFIPHYNIQKGDTAYTNAKIAQHKRFIKHIQSKNILTCLPESYFYRNDSIAFEHNNSLIKSGLSTVMLNNSADTSKFALRKNLLTTHNFGGLTISEINDDNNNLQDTLSSLLLYGSEMLVTKKPDAVLEAINYLITSQKIGMDVIDQKVKKIIQAQLWAKVSLNTQIDSVSVIEKSLQIKLLKRKILKNSLALVKNNDNFIPFKGMKKKKYELLVIGKERLPELEKFLKYYSTISVKFINTAEKNYQKGIKRRIKNSRLIIALNDLQTDTITTKKVQKLSSNSVVLNFKKPKNLSVGDSATSLIQIFGNSLLEQQYAAEMVFGGISANGQLPEAFGNYNFREKLTTSKTRVSRGIPEEVGAKSEVLANIDSIAKSAINRGAFPGCQVFAIKNGQIICEKSYGYQTYSRNNRITSDDIYDIASVTKIAGATLAAMKMFDTGKMKPNDVLGKFFKDTEIEYTRIKPDTIFNLDTLYFEDIKNWKKLLSNQDTVHINDSMFLAYDTLIVTATPKNNIFKVQLKDILTHSSGISPALPILPYLLYRNNYWKKYKKLEKAYEDSLANGFDSATFNIKPREEIQKIFDGMYTTERIKDSSEVQIARSFYLQNHYFDTLWRDTKQLRVYSRQIYQYSDINMILLQQAIDSTNNKTIHKYLQDSFFEDLGLKTIGYQPLKRFNKKRIVPTENEKFWRKQLLTGHVHDPSAALLGGLSGNAGLFTNAHDLAIIGQMWLNGGSYGGKSYISNKTVNQFTKRQPDSHRGLGFDKPGRRSIIGDGAPSSSFGHTGFTGTCLWVDPNNEIVYIFLSNRVHPSAKNWRINTYKVRQKVHTEIYNSIQ